LLVAPPPPAGVLSPEVAERLAAIRPAHPKLHASLLELDASQLSAVLSEERSILVRAPVGSGKTRVLVHRVLYLHQVRGVPLREMGVLTFTHRAAEEVRHRLVALGDKQIVSMLTIDGAQAVGPDDLWLTGTFHGVARALLSVLPVERVGYRPDFTVLDDEACEERLDQLIFEHHLRIRRRRQLRRRLRAPWPAPGDGAPAPRDDLPRLSCLYAADKRAMNAMDFDDLIGFATELLGIIEPQGSAPARPRVKALVVDEMQDCEPRELRFLRQLAEANTSFFAVGDPHQAIYGWRGSAPEVFLQAQEDFGCQVRALTVNYRSTRTIVDGARAVLGLQPGTGTELFTAREPGERIVLRRHHDPLSEALYLAERLRELHAAGIPYRQVAILFRLRAQAAVLRETLTERGIPCQESEDPPADGVRLLTLHASKGLEFRHVFLSGINAGLVPLGRHRAAVDDAEERRLLFVGLTRARDGLEISYHALPHSAGAVGDVSPYLTWLPSSLVDWQDVPAVRGEPGRAQAQPAEVGAAAMPAPSGATFRPGQAVRHQRYGTGAILRIADGVVECDFGKRGARSFPLDLCPLTFP
jgi:superfamily I DNA/RNA helicase